MQLQVTKFKDFKLALPVFTKPLISNRNRLEGVPRSDEFSRSLRAEIADPLWMLCRQWQLGEFEGEDAATACQAKILAEHQRPELIHLDVGPALKYDADLFPLETIVESESISRDYYLCLQMGRQFIKIMNEAELTAHRKTIVDAYAISENIDTEDNEAIYLAQSTSGIFPDGFKILEDIQKGNFETVLKSISGITPSDVNKFLKAVAPQFTNWFGCLYHSPTPGESAWRADRMEYNFELDLPHKEGDQQSFLEAKEYTSGRIDWSTFDENIELAHDEEGATDNFEEVIQSFIPTSLQYSGMPNPRFWQMENNRVDFGKIQTGTSGLLSLLLMEYGLTYSNDWFVLPYQLKINTLCEVKCIMVTDVFGQNILVEPTFKDPELNWHEFACFRHTEIQNRTSPKNRFYLASSILKHQQSEPIEKVNFMRDEMANMVWAIESMVPSAAGGSRRVKSNPTRFEQDFVPAGQEAKIRYLIGTSVPENWIPFIPVHKNGSQQEIRLQRARIPNAPAPSGQLLTEQQPVHFIEEEEVPRAGVIITRMYKRTRWLNGKTYLWIARSKTTGRGEGWSGLMFDQILDV